MNELNVANPMCALDPTATAAVPTMTLGMYSTDNNVRLNCPNTESVIPKRSSIVAQCTTNDPTITTPESPSSASTPAAAARNASGSQAGSGRVRQYSPTDPRSDPDQRTDRVHRQHAAECAQASGVCSWVSTEAASWMTASAIAAISSGPPSADATTHRVTNQDVLRRGGPGGRARGAPHHREHGQQRHHAELAATDRHRHQVHAQPHTRDRTERTGHVAVGDQQLQQHDRRDDAQRHDGRPERDPKQLTRLACADWPVFH